MKINNIENITDEIISGTCLLISVSNADDKLEECEIDIIKEIVIDFFNLDNSIINQFIDDCIAKVESSTDIYEFGKSLNNFFSYQDKIDFICCTYEVAFSDSSMHYLEDHVIKKISSILNVDHGDLIKSKKKMKNILLET